MTSNELLTNFLENQMVPLLSSYDTKLVSTVKNWTRNMLLTLVLAVLIALIIYRLHSMAKMYRYRFNYLNYYSIQISMMNTACGLEQVLDQVLGTLIKTTDTFYITGSNT